MKKTIKNIALVAFCALAFTSYGKTSIISDITGTCSAYFFDRAHDNDENTWYSYDGRSGCDFGLTITLSSTVKAVNIIIISNKGGINLVSDGSNYYTTQGTDDNFYYVNPMGFNTLTLTGIERFTDLKIYEIYIYKIDIMEASVPYVYDAAGNMKTRMLVIGNMPQQKAGTTEIEEEQSEEKFQKDVLAGFNIKLYPNPTEGRLKLAINGINKNDKAAYQLYSSTGVLIKQDQTIGSETLINLSDQAQGMYILKISINGETQNWTIIKK